MTTHLIPLSPTCAVWLLTAAHLQPTTWDRLSGFVDGLEAHHRHHDLHAEFSRLSDTDCIHISHLERAVLAALGQHSRLSN